MLAKTQNLVAGFEGVAAVISTEYRLEVICGGAGCGVTPAHRAFVTRAAGRSGGGEATMRVGGTLIALDVDGVLNVDEVAPGGATGLSSAVIEPLTVQWDPTVIARIIEIEQRPDVTVAWLTDWCKYPAMLRELETAIGVGPWIAAVEALTLPGASHVVWEPTWWKRGGLVELLRETRAQRCIWVDDNLPADGKVTFSRWESQVLPRTGLTHERFDQLEAWLDADPATGLVTLDEALAHAGPLRRRCPECGALQYHSCTVPVAADEGDVRGIATAQQQVLGFHLERLT